MYLRYKLDGKEIIQEPDTIIWAKWFESADRKVARDIISNCRVSTVFIGIDHCFTGGPPLLFETMVFDNTGDEIYFDRYATWDEAEKGHANTIEMVKRCVLV